MARPLLCWVMVVWLMPGLSAQVRYDRLRVREGREADTLYPRRVQLYDARGTDDLVLRNIAATRRAADRWWVYDSEGSEIVFDGPQVRTSWGQTPVVAQRIDSEWCLVVRSDTLWLHVAADRRSGTLYRRLTGQDGITALTVNLLTLACETQAHTWILDEPGVLRDYPRICAVLAALILIREQYLP
ncbi:MAG: hypothetical protein OHK0039_31340 [Bacteroidia bacterium]